MWNKVSNNMYVLSSHNAMDIVTTVEGIFTDINSCVEGAIEILKKRYAAENVDFSEDEIRKEIFNKFNKYNSYWNDNYNEDFWDTSYKNIAFDIEAFDVWKYEKEINT